MATELGVMGVSESDFNAEDYICVSGVWKNIESIYVCVSGAWKPVAERNICISSAWES